MHVGFADFFECRCGSMLFSVTAQSAWTQLWGCMARLGKRHAPATAEMSRAGRKLHPDRNLSRSSVVSRHDPCAHQGYCPDWASDFLSVDEPDVLRIYGSKEGLRRVQERVSIGCEHASSDIDIVVYGYSNCKHVSLAMTRLLDKGAFSLPNLGQSWSVRAPFRSLLDPRRELDTKAYLELLSSSGRLTFKAMYGDRKFDLYFIDTQSSLPVLGPAGPMAIREGTIEGMVSQAETAFLKPSKFELEEVTTGRLITIYSILDATRLLRTGDRVIVCGRLVPRTDGGMTLVMVDNASHHALLQ